jgi:hypothetical protein
MTAPLAEPRPWHRRRWWLFTALILAGQVGAIVWLGDWTPVRVRPPAPAPRLQLAGNASAELLALNDPTLFALPHWQGFSGPAWLDAKPSKPEPLEKPEEPHWLPLAVQDLGAALSGLAQTSVTDSLPRVGLTTADLALPEPAPLAMPLDHSSIVLDGDLVRRQLVTALELSSWTNADILTNSIVRLAVDAAGRPVSAVLLAGSGNRAVDDQALARARSARFEDLRGTGPVPPAGPLPDLTWGEMIFEWHTLPPPATNAPAVK